MWGWGTITRHREYLKLSANVPFFGGKCLPSKSPSMHRIHPNKCRSPRIWPTLKRHRPKLTTKKYFKLSARIRFAQKSLPEFILPSKICERRSRRSRFSQCLSEIQMYSSLDLWLLSSTVLSNALSSILHCPIKILSNERVVYPSMAAAAECLQ